MKTFTSANVKGGNHDGEPRMMYTTKKDHSGKVLAVGLLLVGLLVFVAMHLGMF